MAVTDPYVEPQPPAPATDTPPPKKRPTWRIAVDVVGGLVVLAAAAVGIVFALQPMGPDPKDPASKVAECREQVRAKAKAPSTTNFIGEAVSETSDRAEINGVYGFGAMRGTYKCGLSRDTTGRVQIASVSVSG